MRIVRYLPVGDSRPCYGLEQTDGSIHRAEGDPLGGGLNDTGEIALVDRLLAPIRPAAILCIGLNYAAHAAEGGKPAPERPVLFMKTPAAAQDPGGPIVLPRRLPSTRVDYEAELAVVIGRQGKNVSRNEAMNHVLGYTCGNDVSARDWQRRGGGGQWCRGKTFDTFAPIGPRIVTLDELPDPLDLRISTEITSTEGTREVLQDSRTSDMIFDVPTLIEFLSASTTLLPGTVILTGTPQGVGFARTPPRWLEPGDTVTVEVEGVGRLTNPVIEEAAESLERWELPEENTTGL